MGFFDDIVPVAKAPAQAAPGGFFSDIVPQGVPGTADGPPIDLSLKDNSQPARVGDGLKDYFGGHNPIAETADMLKPAIEGMSQPDDRSVVKRGVDAANFWLGEVPIRSMTGGQKGLADVGMSSAAKSAESYAQHKQGLLSTLGQVGDAAMGLPGAASLEAAAKVPAAASSIPRAAETAGPVSKAAGNFFSDIPMASNPIVTAARQSRADLNAAAEQGVKNVGTGRSADEALASHLENPQIAPVAASTEAQAIDVAKPADAPVAPNAGLPAPQPVNRVITPDNSMEVAAKPELVELSDLKSATGSVQPRDRTRVEYAQDALERANRLDPAQLQPSRVSDSGAPIVGPDGTILSGNGRALSIGEVYSNPALAERAKAYRDSLGPDAANMKRPVLVMRAGPMTPEEAARFADLSNRGRIASMSATERAARDAKALGSDGVSLYQGGDFEAPQNADFLRHFTQGVVTTGERPAFSNGGRLTQEGAQRMRNAVLASAYDDAPTLSKMLESPDDNIRNLTGALTDAAPRMAGLKADIAAGIVKPELDATPQITQAVKTIADLRSRGISADEYFRQVDAFDTTNPLTKEWIRAFYNEDLSRPLSRQKMAEVLNAYADEARLHAPGGLFEDPTGTGDVLNVARKAANETASANGAERGALPHVDGESNGQGGQAAQRQGATASGAEPNGSRAPSGDQGTPDARNGVAAGQSRDRGRPFGTLIAQPSRFHRLDVPELADDVLPATKEATAKRATLAAALDIGGDLSGNRVASRIFELAHSDAPADLTRLAKTKALVGDDVWSDIVAGGLYEATKGTAAGVADLLSGLSRNSEQMLFGDRVAASLHEIAKSSATIERLMSLQKNGATHATLTKLGSAASAANQGVGKVASLGAKLAMLGGSLPALLHHEIMAAALGFTPFGKMALKKANAVGNLAGKATEAVGTGIFKGTVKAPAWLVAKYLSTPKGSTLIERWAKSTEQYLSDPSSRAAAMLTLTATNLAHQIASDTDADEKKLAAGLGAQ